VKRADAWQASERASKVVAKQKEKGNSGRGKGGVFDLGGGGNTLALTAHLPPKLQNREPINCSSKRFSADCDVI
jgi:hypothetical protein